jgi:hypothetical protein
MDGRRADATDGLREDKNPKEVLHEPNIRDNGGVLQFEIRNWANRSNHACLRSSFSFPIR